MIDSHTMSLLIVLFVQITFNAGSFTGVVKFIALIVPFICLFLIYLYLGLLFVSLYSVT